jgi:hypothetical protein
MYLQNPQYHESKTKVKGRPASKNMVSAHQKSRQRKDAVMPFGRRIDRGPSMGWLRIDSNFFPSPSPGERGKKVLWGIIIEGR